MRPYSDSVRQTFRDVEGMFVPNHQRDAIKVRDFCGLMLRGFIGITSRELAPICGMTFSCLPNAVRPRDKAYRVMGGEPAPIFSRSDG